MNRVPAGERLTLLIFFRNACYLAALLILLGALGGVYYYFVRTTTGRYTDQMAFRQAELIQHNLGNGSKDFLDNLPLLSLIIAVIVAVISLAKNACWQQLSRLLLIASAMGAANVSTRLLKVYVFDRPDVGLENWFRNSLPSGHTTLAASSAAAIFLIASPRWRPLIGFLGGSYAIFAGISTVLNQWHRPADVIAAFLVVALWSLICAWIMTKFSHLFTPQAEEFRSNLSTSSIVWIVLSLALGLIPIIMASNYLGPIPTVNTNNLNELLYSKPDSTQFFWYGISLITFFGYSIVIGATIWCAYFAPENYYSVAKKHSRKHHKNRKRISRTL